MNHTTSTETQNLYIPESVKDWITGEELVSIVLRAISINEDLDPFHELLDKPFFGHQPKMLLAVIVAAYASGIYGADAIESALTKEKDLAYLSAGSFPEADTLRSFRRYHPKTICNSLAYTLRYALDLHTPAMEYGSGVNTLDRGRLTISPDFNADAYLHEIASERIRKAISVDSAFLDF